MKEESNNIEKIKNRLEKNSKEINPDDNLIQLGKEITEKEIEIPNKKIKIIKSILNLQNEEYDFKYNYNCNYDQIEKKIEESSSKPKTRSGILFNKFETSSKNKFFSKT